MTAKALGKRWQQPQATTGERTKNRKYVRGSGSRTLLKARRFSQIAGSTDFIAGIVANLKDVVFQTDAQGLWSYLNPAWTEVTGFSLNESMGRLFLDFVHPDDWEHNVALFEPLIARQKEYSRHEVRYMTKAGGYRWVEVHARATVNPADEIVGTSGTLTDITEKVAARDAMQDSRARLASIIQSSLDCIISVDRDQRIIEFNAAAERTFGYQKEDVLGQVMTDLIIPSSMKAAHTAGFARFLQTGEGQNLGKVLELPARRADGSEFIAEMMLSVDQRMDNKPILTAFMRDISQRKQAERQREQAREALEEATSFRQHITDAAPFLIYVYDVVAQRNVYVNEQITAMLGYTTEAVYEMPQCLNAFLIHPEDLPRLHEHSARVFSLQPGEGYVEMEYRMRNTDGAWHWFRSRDTVFRMTQNGNVHQIIGVAEDITERHAAEERERILTAELQYRNRELNDFASVVSHDLQEPLRKIRMFGDRMRRDTRDSLSSNAGQDLDRIENAAERMQTLINDLLDFARISTKTKGLAAVNLNTIIGDVISDLEARLVETSGRIRVSDNLPLVLADSLQMRQLFQNLLGNALKFHRNGVPPVVSIHACSEVAYNAHSFVQLTVSDNGIGFSQKYAAQIFDVFQRLHAVDRYEGTGMGLAICRKIVEHHGGSIKAQGTDGNGATFVITLQAAPQAKGNTDETT